MFFHCQTVNQKAVGVLYTNIRQSKFWVTLMMYPLLWKKLLVHFILEKIEDAIAIHKTNTGSYFSCKCLQNLVAKCLFFSVDVSKKYYKNFLLRNVFRAKMNISSKTLYKKGKLIDAFN